MPAGAPLTSALLEPPVTSTFIRFHRFGRSEIPFAVSMRASVVTRVRSNTLAVAARNVSAGSRWDRRILLVASATAAVKGASLSGAITIDCATHSSTLTVRVTRLFSTRITNSQTLIGESHFSFVDPQVLF